MPDRRRASCRICGRHRDEVGGISWLGLCLDCGTERLVENIEGLAEHKGEPLLRWRVGMVRCALGDDLLKELGVG